MASFADYKLTKIRANCNNDCRPFIYVKTCAFVEKCYNINYEVELVYIRHVTNIRMNGGQDP